MTSNEIQARIRASRERKDKVTFTHDLQRLLKQHGKRARPDLVEKIKKRGYNP